MHFKINERVEEDALENGFMEIDETRAPEGEIEGGQNLERGRCWRRKKNEGEEEVSSTEGVYQEGWTKAANVDGALQTIVI
jgi:hypothetical protein